MSEHCPLEDKSFCAELDGKVYVYSEATDSIQVFPDAKYNYCQYWDSDKRELVWQFLGQTALDILHENGLPHTIRDSITPREYSEWENWFVGNVVSTLDDDLDSL